MVKQKHCSTGKWVCQSFHITGVATQTWRKTKKEREREGERNKNKPSLFYKFSLYRTRSVAPKVIRSPSILFYHSQNLIFLKRLVSIKQRGNKVILGEICLYLQNVNVHIWYSGEHFISAIFLKCKFCKRG